MFRIEIQRSVAAASTTVPSHPCDTPSHSQFAGPYFLVGVPLGTQPSPLPSHWLLELHGCTSRSQQQQHAALEGAVVHGAPWSEHADPTFDRRERQRESERVRERQKEPRESQREPERARERERERERER